MPVMEGKCCLFKEFAGVDAFPICLDTTDTEEIIHTVKLIAPAFGGINLEDISAPRCFEIEERLKEQLDIPVFHDDQHGTAVVVLAALLNAAKLTGPQARGPERARDRPRRRRHRRDEDPARGRRPQIVGADSRGAAARAARGLPRRLDEPVKRWFAESTNPDCRGGAPADVIDGMDLLIGVSGARALPAEALARMNRDAMVFAMANPNPEVDPEEAAPYVRIMATGRSDYPNQINNVLCFPGIFRGALDVRAPAITEDDEDGRRARDRSDRRRRRAARGLHHPVGVQPRRRPGGRGGGGRGGARPGEARAGQEVGFAAGDTGSFTAVAPPDGRVA